jgi:hypothetical protein
VKTVSGWGFAPNPTKKVNSAPKTPYLIQEAVPSLSVLTNTEQGFERVRGRDGMGKRGTRETDPRFFLRVEHWAHVGNWCKDNCANI